MVKIEVKYSFPSWIKGIRPEYRTNVIDIFLKENYYRIRNYIFNYQETHDVLIGFSPNKTGVTLCVKEDNFAYHLADKIRNIRVAMHNDKRMSARIVK